jgi:flagellar biosynthesis/type III secretory pathway protein FliH
MGKQWRCFFCDEVFKSYRAAAEHFGRDDSCEADAAACKIAAHEGHLVHYIRKLEDELRRYQTEDSDVMRAIMTLEAERQMALRRAEEEGYAKGLQDGRSLKSNHPREHGAPDSDSRQEGGHGDQRERV